MQCGVHNRASRTFAPDIAQITPHRLPSKSPRPPPLWSNINVMSLQERLRDPEGSRYADFLRDKGHSGSSVLLHNLHGFLLSRTSEVLDPKTIERLEEAEAKRDDGLFNRIVIAHRHLLDKTTANFLFHRWIRLQTIKEYPFGERAALESIPIAFIPFYPFLDAFITKTPLGNIICFTEALNSVLLAVFYTMAKSAFLKHHTPRYPQLSRLAAEDRIVSIARFVVGGCQEGSVPPGLDVDERTTLMADALNNIAQRFILAHEYSHFLLGHLKESHPGAGIISSGSFKHIDSYATDLEREFAADGLAVKCLRKSNASQEGVLFNATLYSGIEVFFMFNAICKKLLGYKASGISDGTLRAANVRECLFADADTVYILEEAEVVRGALERV